MVDEPRRHTNLGTRARGRYQVNPTADTHELLVDIAGHPTPAMSRTLPTIVRSSRGTHSCRRGTGLVADHGTVYQCETHLTNKVAELTINNTAITWTTPAFNLVTTNLPRTIGAELQKKF